MKIFESEHGLRCRMNSLSGWKKQPEQIQAWPEMEPLPEYLCDDWTQQSIHWANQANWRAGYGVTYLMVEMTWLK